MPRIDENYTIANMPVFSFGYTVPNALWWFPDSKIGFLSLQDWYAVSYQNGSESMPILRVNRCLFLVGADVEKPIFSEGWPRREISIVREPIDQYLDLERYAEALVIFPVARK